MAKIIFYLGLLLIISSCYNVPKIVKPASWVFNQMPKDAPPIFKQAWKDGCESGLSSMTNNYYKTFYRFTQDPVLRKDPVYYKTWVDTFTFCRHYIYGPIREGNVRMTLPMTPNAFLDNISVGDGIFNSGALRNMGPGTWGLLIENWGVTGGDGFFETMNGEIDFSGDMSFNGSSNPIMDWNLQPDHSIVPW